MGAASEPVADAMRFDAFVSYSHQDSAIAGRLHRKLESYRLPKHLRDQISDVGAANPRRAGGRLGKIFRDRDDLPAAEDLSESVKSALAVSDSLIVLCSPGAKASPWVAKEIETFRALHPDGPILAALVDGEPEEAFPEPLLHGKEPLAADLRKEGDGWRLGFLKIVAGLSSVPLDALVQRDAQRRLRSVMAVTGGAIAAVLIMAAMTYIALQSRNEAQQQQAQAEGLVEYMLTDLRAEMEEVGRLDVMKNVNERAMNYYEAQGDLASLPSESLIRRSLILRKMGEDDHNADDSDAALKKFQESYRTTSVLIAENGDNPQIVLAHLQSENWLGYYTNYRGKLNEAQAAYLRTKKLGDQLAEEEHDNPEWIRQISFMYGNICTAHLSQEKPNTWAAVRFCHAALNNAVRLSEKLPDDQATQVELAVRYAFYGQALLSHGELDSGLTNLRKHLVIIDGIVSADPQNIHWRGQQASSYMGMAEQFAEYDKIDEALGFATKARRMIDQLIAHDKANQDWPKWLKRLQRLDNNIKQ